MIFIFIIDAALKSLHLKISDIQSKCGITPEYPTHPTVSGLGLGFRLGLGIRVRVRVRD